MSIKRNRFRTLPLIGNISPTELIHVRNSRAAVHALRDLLRNSNISEQEFALIMQRDESEIRGWLSGRKDFDLKTLYYICEQLGLL